MEKIEYPEHRVEIHVPWGYTPLYRPGCGPAFLAVNLRERDAHWYVGEKNEEIKNRGQYFIVPCSCQMSCGQVRQLSALFAFLISTGCDGYNKDTGELNTSAKKALRELHKILTLTKGELNIVAAALWVGKFDWPEICSEYDCCPGSPYCEDLEVPEILMERIHVAAEEKGFVLYDEDLYTELHALLDDWSLEHCDIMENAKEKLSPLNEAVEKVTEILRDSIDNTTLEETERAAKCIVCALYNVDQSA